MKLTAEQMEHVARVLNESAYAAMERGHIHTAATEFALTVQFREAAARAHAPGHSRRHNKDMAKHAKAWADITLASARAKDAAENA